MESFICCDYYTNLASCVDIKHQSVVLKYQLGVLHTQSDLHCVRLALLHLLGVVNVLFVMLHQTGISLSRLNISHREMLSVGFVNHGIKSRVTRLGVPWLGSARQEQFLNFFNGFAACFGIGEVKLNRSEHTHGAEDDEHAVSDVDEPWWDVKTQSKVKQPGQAN